MLVFKECILSMCQYGSACVCTYFVVETFVYIHSYGLNVAAALQVHASMLQIDSPITLYAR